MSSVNLNIQDTALNQLRSINLMAQSTEGSIAGRIGMLKGEDGQDRVIKFNTHLGERMFGPKMTPEMLQSSNNLREQMCKLLDDVLQGNADLANNLKRQIGDSKTSKKLLDRSVVANVIKKVEDAVNQGKDGADKVSLGNDEYSSYGKSSYGLDTHFSAVIGRANGDQPTAVADNTDKGAHPYGETEDEIKANIGYDNQLENLPEEKLKEKNSKGKPGTLSKVLVNDLKRLEFDEKAKEAAKKTDIGLKTLKDFPIESADDTTKATTKQSFEDLFEVVDGSTAAVVKNIYDRDHNAKICSHIFADNTDFLCGIDVCWTTQEEAQAYVSDNAPFQKLIADGKVKLVQDPLHTKDVNGQAVPQWRWRYTDGEGSLDAVDSYIFKCKQNRDTDLNKLDPPIDLDWEFAAMPSFDVGTSCDVRGNLAYLCKCRGIPNSPITPQLVNARKFIEAAIAKAQSLSPDQQKDVMKLLMFSGDNDVFKVFSGRSEEEAQKLIDFVKSGKHTVKGKDGGPSMLDKAQAQYKSTLLKVVSGWVAAARERGATHFISGAAGLGAFAGDPDVVAEVMAEAFVKHGGNMKFVFAKYSNASADGIVNMCKMREKFIEKFNELRGVSTENTAPDQSANVAGKIGEVISELGKNASDLQDYNDDQLGAIGGLGNKDKGFPWLKDYTKPILSALKAAKIPRGNDKKSRQKAHLDGCILAINIMSKMLDILHDDQPDNKDDLMKIRKDYQKALENVRNILDAYEGKSYELEELPGKILNVFTAQGIDERLSSRALLVLTAVGKYVWGK